VRIVHLLAYYGDYFGGIQHSVGEVSRRQAAWGHQVTILTSDKFGSSRTVDGVPVRRLKTTFEAYRVPFTPQLPFTLGSEACDVLHVYLPLPWFDLCAALKKRMSPRTKLVVSIRNFLPNATSVASRVAIALHDRVTVQSAVGAADAVVFTNAQFAAALPYQVPREKMFIVPNGVDTQVFRPNSEYAYDPKQVLFVGRLIPEKGLDVLMGAMQRVRAKIPDMRLTAVVSDYYHQTAYLTRVLSLDDGFLSVKSRLPLAELAQLYRDAAVFVLPSVGLESFGNVLLEAMASGCPVVATDLPGPAGVVQAGARFDVGTVVSRGDIEALAGAIIREAQGNSAARRARIVEYMQSQASWDTVTKDIMCVYARC
jgi:glycosyltransferase involved in cell wall biosynthesis